MSEGRRDRNVASKQHTYLVVPTALALLALIGLLTSGGFERSILMAVVFEAGVALGSVAIIHRKRTLGYACMASACLALGLLSVRVFQWGHGWLPGVGKGYVLGPFYVLAAVSGALFVAGIPAIFSRRDDDEGGDDGPEEGEDVQPPPPSYRIFVSYRRDDTPDMAGRISDELNRRYGRKLTIFRDVDSIPPGADFRQYISGEIEKCDVLLSVVGNGWTGRLNDPDDYVRLEVESVLRSGTPIIPLFVDGTSMPSEASLPSALSEFVYRQGIKVRSDPDFHRDIDRLVSALDGYRSGCDV